MKYIGNIVTTSKIDGMELFNIVPSTNDIIVGIPTLVVGWENLKTNIKNSPFKDAKPNIIDYEVIENTLYWTYGRKVRRDVYERDLVRFKNLCIKLVTKEITYSFFLITSTDRFRSLLNWINGGDKKKTVYTVNDLSYIYMDGCKKVVGISLRDIEYIGEDKKEFFRNIYSNNNVTVISSEQVSMQVRSDFRNSTYIVPYIYSGDFSK